MKILCSRQLCAEWTDKHTDKVTPWASSRSQKRGVKNENEFYSISSFSFICAGSHPLWFQNQQHPELSFFGKGGNLFWDLNKGLTIQIKIVEIIKLDGLPTATKITQKNMRSEKLYSFLSKSFKNHLFFYPRMMKRRGFSI